MGFAGTNGGFCLWISCLAKHGVENIHIHGEFCTRIYWRFCTTRILLTIQKTWRLPLHKFWVFLIFCKHGDIFWSVHDLSGKKYEILFMTYPENMRIYHQRMEVLGIGLGQKRTRSPVKMGWFPKCSGWRSSYWVASIFPQIMDLKNLGTRPTWNLPQTWKHLLICWCFKHMP